jgi:hypothetical protein
MAAAVAITTASVVRGGVRCLVCFGCEIVGRGFDAVVEARCCKLGVKMSGAIHGRPVAETMRLVRRSIGCIRPEHCLL